MDNKKKLFKVDIEDIQTPVEKTKIVKYDIASSWEGLFAMIPSPEEEFENIDKESGLLKEKIEELKDVIQKIEKKVSEIDDVETIEFLNNKKKQYISILETYESDLSYNAVHKKSLRFLINDTSEDDEKFQSQIPALLVNTYVSTKKKMEDVNSLVQLLETKTKNNKIEECMECQAVIKDKDGRKTMLKHFHFTNFDTLEHHCMTICIDCAQKVEELQPMIFNEDSIESNYICKKGKHILSCSVEKESLYLTSKFKVLQEIEGKMFVENLNKDSKKSIFSMLFGND
jgi:hypothetical protein